MERIESQYKEEAQLAKSLLCWITLAERRMSVAELQHALAVVPGASEFDEQNLPDIELLVSVCAGLVTMDKAGNSIQLAHYTAQEYLQQTHEKWFPESQSKITTTCVTYLSYEVFENRSLADNIDFQKLSTSFPFYGYAAYYWGHHARRGSLIPCEVMKFLECKFRVELSRRVWSFIEKRDIFTPIWHVETVWGTTGLHLAALFGLADAVTQLLLYNDVHINATDSIRETPLHVACNNGHELIAQLLIEKGANIEAIRHGRETVLHRAVRSGHEAPVQLLLKNGAKVKTRNWLNETVLHTAMEGSCRITKILLDHGADIEAPDMAGRKALHIAAMDSKGDNVQLLIDRGANVNAIDGFRRTPLHLAAGNDRVATAQLLLTNGADIEAADIDGRRPLSYAVPDGSKDIIELLLNNGALMTVDLASRRLLARPQKISVLLGGCMILLGGLFLNSCSKGGKYRIISHETLIFITYIYIYIIYYRLL